MSEDSKVAAPEPGASAGQDPSSPDAEAVESPASPSPEAESPAANAPTPDATTPEAPAVDLFVRSGNATLEMDASDVGITPPPSRAGKLAADIAMARDALAALHRG
jgi:hypothetical protein